MQRNISKRLSVWAVIVTVLLMIPLVAMQYSNEVNWGVMDFVFGAISLFGAATVYELVTRNTEDQSRRFFIGGIVLLVLAFIWVGAATGYEGIFDRIEQFQNL